MYRFVIEHPRWIPQERLAKLDVRAGSDRGRIYRIFPRGRRLTNHSDLSNLKTPDLARKLNSGNGILRDAIHQELVRRRDKSAVAPLQSISKAAKIPQARLQALCALEGIGQLKDSQLLAALSDKSAGVRRHAVRLCESRLAENPALAKAALKLTADPDPTVRCQLALTLGNWRDSRAGAALGAILARDMDDPWIRAAVLSSASTQPAEIFQVASKADNKNSAGRGLALGQLIATATAGPKDSLESLLPALIQPLKAKEAWSWQSLVAAQDVFDRKRIKITDLANSSNSAIKDTATQLGLIYLTAAPIATDSANPADLRSSAIRMLGRGFNSYEADLPALAAILNGASPASLKQIALDGIARRSSDRVPKVLLGRWAKHSPALRTSIIAKLMTRSGWIAALLDAVESGRVSPADIDPVTRLRLSRNSNPAVVKRVDKLLPLRNSPDRKAVIQQYQGVANLSGDRSTGAAVFKTNCAPCHRLNGQGFEVGPDLSVYRNKGVADLLEAILDPNAIIEPRFVNYMVETDDDRSLTGLIASESVASLTLLQAQGVKESIQRGDIREIRASTLSLMPDGLETAIPPQAMADLIAYLKHTP